MADHLVTERALSSVDEALVLTPEWGTKYVVPAFAGDPEAASSLFSSLHDYQRASMVRLMFEAQVAPSAFRMMLTGALDQTHHYDQVLSEAGTRGRFNKWCRYASYELPAPPQASYRIYRGVGSASIARARKGLSWTLDFECAAWFACRRNAVSPLVIETVVTAKHIVFYSDERSEAEVIPSTVSANADMTFHIGPELISSFERREARQRAETLARVARS